MKSVKGFSLYFSAIFTAIALPYISIPFLQISNKKPSGVYAAFFAAVLVYSTRDVGSYADI